MRLLFRTDASTQIGHGHVMRCLTLANALRQQGAHCSFACRPHPGNLLDLVVQHGHEALSLPDRRTEPDDSAAPWKWLGSDWASDASDTLEAAVDARMDFVVVDHYAIDERWEQVLRPHCKQLVVIDDLADRAHDCDLLLDQNHGRDLADYDGLLPPRARRLIGAGYALLRPEFAQWRLPSLQRRRHPTLAHVLIAMGGADQHNTTTQVLQAFAGSELSDRMRLTVVLGANAPWLQEVRATAKRLSPSVQVLAGVTRMAELMAPCDLAIGAGGSSSWERCCLGVPSLTLALAANQVANARTLECAGASMTITDLRDLPSKLEFLSSPLGLEQLGFMSEAGATITDGLGAQRCLEALLNHDV